MLSNDKDYCIILYEDAPNRGHWTKLLKYDGLYEHFDSYGVKPVTGGAEVDKCKEKPDAQPGRALHDTAA